ncbi:cytochrome d ubiquinol oxidase subunit II [Paenibacillus cineris]|uniref:cytochrome d ubiquinol oxidase subunit II n=1 Tax=Paenibacillus cineris TaxID=237530 RepID=UPI001B1D937D|nr:cytochrome d ubiquinol oxidase subunit II [Paenibacillus cineris]GIO61488.1 membrane protein [Paenibacillus cineris]
MSDTQLAITILWCFIFIYSIAGSIDFGAGFWSMVFSRRNPHAADIANRFLSPSWEVTNVFLVLLVVALVGFFPRAAYVLGTLLLVPVSLVLVLLLFRSAFIVYSYSVQKHELALRIVSGITGLLIPGLLVSVLPISLGGFIHMSQGFPQLEFGKLLTSATLYAHVGFGILTELFLSALFLSDYGREAGDEQVSQHYRSIAVVLGPLALAMAVLATFTMVPEALWIVARMQEQSMWFLLSVVAFAIGYGALWIRRKNGRKGWLRLSVVAVILQFALASYAYGRAHMPYIVHPDLTVEAGFTNHSMFVSLLWGYGFGTVILLPAFILFWWLFLKDKRYLRTK